MTKSIWFWLVVGWLASLVYSPSHVVGMFKGKSAA